ncbi:hypothetical protein C2S52_006265 [Perilla frutescens var. hirtella]|nr:hypothetical protein C2S52_006265 [Perilla frutescens var. hirtella]
MAFNLYERKDGTGQVTQQEVFLLWNMVHKRKVNLGYILAIQLQAQTSNTRATVVALGTFVARIFECLKGGDLDDVFEGYPELDEGTEYLDAQRLERMQLVGFTEENTPYFLLIDEPTYFDKRKAPKAQEGSPRAQEGPSRAQSSADSKKLERVEKALQNICVHLGLNYPSSP